MKIADPNDRTTLLLNSAWLPITVITARASFLHALRGRTKGLDRHLVQTSSFEDWLQAEHYDDQPVLRSASDVWPVPTLAVVTNRFFRHSRRRKLLSVQEMAKIYDNTCQYCLKKYRTKDLTIDHIKPRALGGDNDEENRTLACRFCNTRKGHQFPVGNVKGEPVVGAKAPSVILNPSQLRPEWAPLLKTTVYARYFEPEKARNP